MINLCLVVIATQFSETKKREMERMAVERARRRRHSRSSSTLTSRASVQVASEGCYDEMLAYLGYLVRLAQRRVARLVRLARRHYRRTPQTLQVETEDPPVYAVTRPRRKRKSRNQRRMAASVQRRAVGARRRPGEAPCASPELSDIDLTESPRRPRKRSTTIGELGAAGTALPTPCPPLPGNDHQAAQLSKV